MTGNGGRVRVGGRARFPRPLVVAAVALLPLAGPAVARADQGAGGDARYYVTTLTSVSPSIPGLTVEVTRSGEWVRVANTSGTAVTVLGYTDEPYLLIGPAGTQENQSSLSAYLNDSLVISQVPPDWTVRPVQWKTVSGAPSYSWHDHRVHWMTSTRPPVVAADPEHPHLVSTWTIRMRRGDTLVTATGTLSWAGRPSRFGSIWSRFVWGIGLSALLIVVWRVVAMRRRDTSGGRASGDLPA